MLPLFLWVEDPTEVSVSSFTGDLHGFFASVCPQGLRVSSNVEIVGVFMFTACELSLQSASTLTKVKKIGQTETL